MQERTRNDKKTAINKKIEPLSRRDYQEILLAKLAGGDLYAMETLQKIRRVDMMLDRFRIACGDKPLYPQQSKYSEKVD